MSSNYPDDLAHKKAPFDDDEKEIKCPKCGSYDTVKTECHIGCMTCGYHVEKEWSN